MINKVKKYFKYIIPIVVSKNKHLIVYKNIFTGNYELKQLKMVHKNVITRSYMDYVTIAQDNSLRRLEIYIRNKYNINIRL